MLWCDAFVISWFYLWILTSCICFCSHSFLFTLPWSIAHIFVHFPLQLWMMLVYLGAWIMGSMLVWFSSWSGDFSYLNHMYLCSYWCNSSTHFGLETCCLLNLLSRLVWALAPFFMTSSEDCCYLLTCDHLVIICDVLKHV